jgi:hypothetical protein
MSFPTSKAYNASFKSNARVTVWTDARLRADKTEEKQRVSARCAPVGCRTRASASKSSGKNSGSISPQSLMNWLLCRSAEAGF